MRTFYWVHALAIAAMLCPAATAEPGTKELLQMIESLKERVESLEAELATQKEKSTGGIEERVDAIEEKLETSPAVPKDEDFRVYWKEGLRFDTRDGNFKLKIGGRTQVDWAWFDDSDDLRIIYGDVEDAVVFRRARLEMSGQIYNDFDFKAEYDFAGGDADFRDVYIAAKNIPHAGVVRIGQFKESFSLEELNSDNDITFIERALPNALSPSRSTGIAVGNNHLDQRMTWNIGFYRATDDYGFHAQDGGYNVTARVTGLPWIATESDSRLFHLGASFSHREPDGAVQFRQRPETGLAPRYVDTGMISAENVELYGLEAALLYERFSLQGEYMMSEVDSPLSGDLSFDGWYAQASIFLTPDHRTYKATDGVFGGVKPSRPFQISGDTRGPGAWELALRFSEIDLTDEKIYGGEEDNFTIGLNWYLNPNMRAMFNYIKADIDRQPLYDGELDIFTTRIQIYF